jgi:hypothetical protein
MPVNTNETRGGFMFKRFWDCLTPHEVRTFVGGVAADNAGFAVIVP